jgi:hypothetical protein
MKPEQKKKINDVRLDIDTWLGLNEGPMPREYVVEIHQRLLSAISQESQPEYKAGIDLDRAIAGVIGLVCTQRVLGSSNIEFYVDPRSGTNTVPRMFKPSTDLNDAFYAAEKVAANEYGEWALSTYIGVSERGWTCSLRDDSERAFATTPALAICAAILKVERT